MDQLLESQEQSSQKAGLREWVGLSVLALACLLYVMDLTVLHLAIPSISSELKPSSTALLWIIDIYGFMVAGFLITMGTLGDRIGRRKLLLYGAATFGAISILTAFSTSTEMLIVCRALLGIAGATLAPSTLSLIFSMFKDAKQRSMAIAVWISAFSAGSAIGPVLGGIVLEHYWWGSVFLLAVPVMVMLLILGPKVLPEYRDPNAGRLDILSVLMSLAAVLSVVFGVKEIAESGLHVIPIISIAVGIVIGILFTRRQLTLDDPMIDITLFRIQSLRASLVVNVLSVFVMFGYFLFVAQYFQLVIGLSPFEAGMWSVPSALAFIIGSNIVPRVAHHIRPAYVIGICLMIAAIGLGVMTQVGGDNGVTIVVAASVIISIAIAPVFGLTTELIVGSAPPERAGAASGIAETASELGGALGISILGSIGVAVYRGGMTNSLSESIPADVSAVAHNTLGAAMNVAQELPSQIGKELITVARTSFVDGMVFTAILCVMVAIAASLLSVFLLKDVQSQSQPTHL